MLVKCCIISALGWTTCEIWRFCSHYLFWIFWWSTHIFTLSSSLHKQIAPAFNCNTSFILCNMVSSFLCIFPACAAPVSRQLFTSDRVLGTSLIDALLSDRYALRNNLWVISWSVYLSSCCSVVKFVFRVCLQWRCTFSDYCNSMFCQSRYEIVFDVLFRYECLWSLDFFVWFVLRYPDVMAPSHKSKKYNLIYYGWDIRRFFE